MKRFPVLLVLLILAACTQVPTPGDRMQLDLTPLVFGGPGDEGVSDLAKHSTGLYAVGFTTNTGRPNPEGDYDAFIRKYRSSGSVIWTRKFGTPESESVYGASSDSSNNAYIVGSTYGNLAGARGGEDAFIRKYTPGGQVAWTRQFGTAPPEDYSLQGFDYPTGVATYGSNAVYVVGRTEGKLGGSVGDGGLFIRKYTSSGSVSWTRQFGFSEFVDGYENISGVAVDGGGNAYVVGATEGSLDTSNGVGSDIFVRKYSSSGSVLWTRRPNFSFYEGAEAVAVLGSNVYVGVRYVADASNPDDYEYGVRIVKFSTSGVRTQGWGYVYNSVRNDYVSDLSTDRDGNIYFSGSTQATATDAAPSDDDGVVVKLNPSGARVWSKRVASSGNDWAAAVLARTTSEVYVAGFTDGVLGDANRGNTDPFLRRLRGSDGSTVWTEQ